MDIFEEKDGEAVNPSTAPAIGELISRRTMLKGMAASSALGLFGCSTAKPKPAPTPGPVAGDGSSPLTFAELARTTDDKSHVPPGYYVQVLLRQGDQIRPGAPQYNPVTQTR